MEYILSAVGGLLVGAIFGWLIAGKLGQSALLRKRDDASDKVAVAETKAASAEATATEVRRQYEEIPLKAAEDFEQLRRQLSSESEARVRAETEKEELSHRLEDEKRSLQRPEKS